MIFLRRLAVYFLIWLILISLGWKLGLALAIFFIALDPDNYAYLFLGPIFDLNFSFPFGFFTLLFLFLKLGSEILAEYSEADNIINVAMRALILSAGSYVALFFIYLYRLWPEASYALGLFIKDALLMLFSLSFIIILYQYWVWFYAKKELSSS